MPESYSQVITRELRQMQALAEGAMAQVSDEQFFAAPAPDDNSIAVIVKHVAGNMASRWTDFLTSDGEKPTRDRDAEFELGPADTRAQLLQAWARGWALLYAALTPLVEADLARTVTVRGEPLTVLQAINRQLTHYPYHVGQIVYVAKHHRGPAWRTLSIPKGRSAEFNRNPPPYIPKA